MKFLHAVILCLVLVTLIEARRKHNRTSHPRWKDHVSKHKLNFKHEKEEIEAFNCFHDVDDQIEAHNSNESHSFKLGHNEFSHWTEEQKSKLFGLATKDLEKFERRLFARLDEHQKILKATPGYVPPASVDWVAGGFNTPVRYQGMCGACWAFAATGAIEAAFFFRKRQSVVVSPQQLVDCSAQFGNNGCGGGLPNHAFEYVLNYGISEEKYYPFNTKDYIQTPCNYNNLRARGVPFNKLTQYFLIDRFSDAALMEAVAKHGPIAVSIDGSGWFQQYSGGIFAQTPGYCTQNLGHAVLLTGYGTDANGNKYWKIKNQWGHTWGDKGYALISRNTPNNCGISSLAFLPMV